LIKLYGIPQSRAMRCLWMVGETGQPYELIPVVTTNGKITDPDLRRVNPNDKMPALVDGDVRIFESLAINIYLAEKYAPELRAKSPAEAGAFAQWSLWAANEIEQASMDWATHAFLRPEDQRDAKIAAAAKAKIDRALGILDGALKDRDWLVGNRFTVADVNVASVCYPPAAVSRLGELPQREALVRCLLGAAGGTARAQAARGMTCVGVGDRRTSLGRSPKKTITRPGTPRIVGKNHIPMNPPTTTLWAVSGL
jgi:glutathione S-transferase